MKKKKMWDLSEREITRKKNKLVIIINYSAKLKIYKFPPFKQLLQHRSRHYKYLLMLLLLPLLLLLPVNISIHIIIKKKRIKKRKKSFSIMYFCNIMNNSSSRFYKRKKKKKKKLIPNTIMKLFYEGRIYINIKYSLFQQEHTH